VADHIQARAACSTGRGSITTGLHGVDVWDTQEHFDRFVTDLLGPATEKVGMSPPQTKSFDVHSFLTAH